MDSNYGMLLTPDIKLHRKWFDEMVKLLGIKVLYRAPRPDKHWSNFTEIEANYEAPIAVGCIFEEHPTQKTMKKLGWDAELQTDASIIHVAYDTPNLQVGSLFIIPSGLDYTKGRLFRVAEMSVGIVYPASVSCKIVPEWENTYADSLNHFEHTSFNLLNNENIDNV